MGLKTEAFKLNHVFKFYMYTTRGVGGRSFLRPGPAQGRPSASGPALAGPHFPGAGPGRAAVSKDRPKGRPSAQ